MEDLLSQTDKLAQQIASLDDGGDKSELTSILDQLRSAVAKRKNTNPASDTEVLDTLDTLSESSPNVSKSRRYTNDQTLEPDAKFAKDSKVKRAVVKVSSSEYEVLFEDSDVDPSDQEYFDDSDDDSFVEEDTDGKPGKGKSKTSSSAVFNGPCRICQIETALSTNHQQEVVGDIQLPSLKSQHIFSSSASFINHMKEKHLETDGVSDKKPQNDSEDPDEAVQRDVSKTSKKSYLKCPYCSKQYSLHSTTINCYNHLLFHLYRKHGDNNLPNDFRLYSCDVCSFETLRRRDLVRHMKVVHTEVDIKSRGEPCTVCGKYVLKSSMMFHMAAVHNAQDVPDQVKARTAKVKCDICDKEFRGHIGLERHKKCVHSRIKDHLCHLCSQTFFAKRDLQLHMFASHRINMSNMKVLKCPVEGCEYATLARRHLMVHSAVHKDTKDFTCEHCGKTFKSQPAIRQHIRIMHTKDTEYQCPVCDFKSHAKQYVSRHMVIHNETKAHKCPYDDCSYETHFIENLTKHRKKHSKGK